QPGLHRPRARDLNERLDRRPFLDEAAIRIEVEARPRGWIAREIDQFPGIGVDPLLTVDVAGRVGKPRDIARVEVTALDDAESGLPWLGAIILACPENVAVAAADHADDTPGIVIVDGRRGIRAKTSQHQSRSTLALPEDGEAGAGIVKGGQPRRIDQRRVGKRAQ